MQTGAHYGTLEVARGEQGHSTLEVEQPALEAYRSQHRTGPWNSQAVDDQAVYNGRHKEDGGESPITTKKPRSKRKPFIILGIVLLVIIIGAIIGGAVGGTLSHKHNGTPHQSISNKTASNTDLGQSTTPTTSNSPIGTTAHSGTPSTTPFTSNLASVSYRDKDNTVQYRLYHQDSKGMVKESAWNSRDQEWYIGNEGLALAKPGSPLAAAITPDMDSFQQLNLYCIDPNGYLVEMFYGFDGVSGWQNGSLTARKITPASNSNIAAMWQRYDGCKDCYGTPLLVAYEDGGNAIQFGNLSSSGAQWATLQANPTSGSGLALNLLPRSDGSAAFRLYYQYSGGGLVSLDYETRSGESDTGQFIESPSKIYLIDPFDLDNGKGWNLHEDSGVGAVSNRAPLASFISRDTDNEGAPYLMDVLSSSSQGVSVTWWSGSEMPTLQTPQSPEVMVGVQNYSAIAANDDRQVFAFQDGSVKQFTVSQNGMNWSLVGNVDTVAP
ncbi:MAG: hypothetical protein Q9214_003408 [Letrouitia sp. 1 TL-2023]